MKKILSIIIIMGLFGCSSGTNWFELYKDEGELAKSGSHYRVKEIVEDIETNVINFKITALDGVYCFWNIDVARKTQIDLTYNMNTLDGQFKLIYVTPDESVVVVAHRTKNGSLRISLPVGATQFKIVGVDADTSIKVSYIVLKLED